MQGQIIKIISNLYVVNSDSKDYECKCRGRIKHEKITPLVGDYVEFDEEKKVIEKILPRKSSFIRPAVANIDRAFIITSLKIPDFSTNLLDKLLVLMELHNVEPIICITKKDLVDDEEFNNIKKILDYYEKIGYEVVYNTELDKIKKMLSKKTSVFTGQTGAGKSTLLNKLNKDFNLETGEVSKSLGRGRHTTRVVELFELDNGKVLDTPGFSALDFYEYDDSDIKNAFIEFSSFPCEYGNCMHINEKECKVKMAVEDNNILETRYKNYVKFLERK